REVLVDGRDALRARVARRAEAHLLSVDQQPSLVRPVGAGEDLDEGGLAGAVVAEDARHLARVHVGGDVLERDDVAVVLADAVNLQQVRRRGHRAFSARLRTTVLSRTAAKRIAPTKV